MLKSAMLHVPSSCGHPIVLISDILFIKKYTEMGRRPAPIAQLVECPLRGTGGHGFDPGPRHTKVVKNGTSCSIFSFVLISSCKTVKK